MGMSRVRQMVRKELIELRQDPRLFGLVIILAPFVWMISTSLKPPNEIFSTKLSLLPTNWAAAEMPALRRAMSFRSLVDETKVATTA